MFSTPKLALTILLIAAVWYASRWLNRTPPPKVVRRRQASSPQPAIEDLVACGRCGAYVAAGAHGCGEPGCPQPR